MTARTNLFSLLAVSLIACGGGSNNNTKIDAPRGSDVDAPAQVDAAPTCAIANELPVQSATTLAGGQGAIFTAGSGSDLDNEVDWFGDTGSDASDVEFQLLTFSGGGSGTDADATPDWPTTFGPKSAIELGATSTVDAITLALGDIDTSTGKAGAIYLGAASPDGGTLTLTQASDTIGSTFAGTITADGSGGGAGFVHVDIDQTSGAVTPDPDGCTSNVDGFTMNATVKAAGSNFAPTENLAPRAHLDRDQIAALRAYVLTHRHN